MAGIRMRTFGRVLIYAHLAVVLIAVMFFCSGVFYLFDHTSEFTDLPAVEAKNRLSDWSADVSVYDMKTVSYKSESSIDSGSTWYRIHLTPKAAETWATSIHSKRKRWGADRSGDHTSGYEGVHRIISELPPQHQAAGRLPGWWHPRNTQFRATEVMVWYDEYDSGVGAGTYSAFDSATSTLWICDYVCQHDILWKRGELPDGDEWFGDQAL